MAEPLIDEKRVVRISLGYLVVLSGLLVAGIAFVTQMRSDVMQVLGRIEKHEIMLERNQESIIDLQIELKEFRTTYDRDMDRYFREHPESHQ